MSQRQEQQSEDQSQARERARFWSFVVKDTDPAGCWIWMGAVADDGYGRFWIKREGKQRAVRPHRYAYAITHGQAALESAAILMHSCDVPLCVKAVSGPGSHLWAGTQLENMADKILKGHHGNQYIGPKGLTRAESAARSRQLRESIKNGVLVGDAVAQYKNLVSSDQLRLF